MAKFKEVMTTENLSDYLDQHARIDVHNGLVYLDAHIASKRL